MRKVNPQCAALELRAHTCHAVIDLWGNAGITTINKAIMLDAIRNGLVVHRLEKEIVSDIGFLLGILSVGEVTQ